MYTHTPECLQKQSESPHKRNVWQSQWPFFCHTCEAVGYREESQSHPYGSTTATEYFDEWCPDCLDAGLCPRCGKSIPQLEDASDISQVLCPFCHWHGDQAEDTMPAVYRCYHDEIDSMDCNGQPID